MSVPVYESSVEALENLDFSICCDGKVSPFPIASPFIVPCDNVAKWMVIYACGCNKVKCFSCFKALLVRHAKIQEADSTMYCRNCYATISFDYTINSI